jgi:hypothetical protein
MDIDCLGLIVFEGLEDEQGAIRITQKEFPFSTPTYHIQIRFSWENREN